ncbi:MAG: hypothetical protein WDO19_12340 [Bacteroidota bacterium]
MEEKKISERESLHLINRMIYEAQGYYYENGFSALVYGFSILICSLMTYMIEDGIAVFPFNPFYLLIPVFFIQAWIQYKQDKQKKAKTFTDEVTGYVWVGFFLCAIISFSAFFAGLGYIVVTIILFLTGFACFLTGMIAKFRYHVISSVICLLLAACSFFILNKNSYLLLAAVAVMVWVVPGFILRAKFKAIQKEKKN